MNSTMRYFCVKLKGTLAIAEAIEFLVHWAVRHEKFKFDPSAGRSKGQFQAGSVNFFAVKRMSN
jgi:hypothetical protein